MSDNLTYGLSERKDRAAAYERIRDLTHRIGDCQRRIGQQLSEGRQGGVRALGLAGQIAADAQELRALLQARNEAMPRV